MITYVDSSVLARALLANEQGHDVAVQMLGNKDALFVTGTWTRIEVTGALVRAARQEQSEVELRLLATLDAELGSAGNITVLAAPQPEVEQAALALSRLHGIRAMDAWHLAVASMVVPPLAGAGPMGFATRDEAQARVAESLGFETV